MARKRSKPFETHIVSKTVKLKNKKKGMLQKEDHTVLLVVRRYGKENISLNRMSASVVTARLMASKQ